MNIPEINIKNEKTKQLLIFLLIALVAGIITFTLYWFYTNNQSTPIEEYPLAEVDVITQVEPNLGLELFDTGEIIVEDTFNIEKDSQNEMYSYKYIPFVITEEYISNVKETFKLTETKELPDLEGKIIIALSDSESVKFYTSTNEIIYSVANPATPGLSNFESSTQPSDYEKYAEKHLALMGFDTNELVFATYRYIKKEGPELKTVNSPTEADHIEITYNKNVDEIPLIAKSGDLAPNYMSVLINSEGRVTKATLQPTGEVQENLGLFKLKNDEQIANAVRNGEAKLINGTFSAGENVLITNVEHAKLSYYAINDYIIPIYVLSGTSLTEDKLTGTGLVFLEAVAN